MSRVVLLSRPGCHLCDDARAVLVEELGDGFDERSIVADADLEREYAEDIPVVLIDGRVHSTWTVDAARLRAALARPSVG